MLQTLIDWVAESPKFPAPLVIDTSLARVDAPPHSELKWRDRSIRLGWRLLSPPTARGRIKRTFSMPKELGTYDSQALSRSKERSSVIGSNFTTSGPDRTRVLSLVRFRWILLAQEWRSQNFKKLRSWPRSWQSLFIKRKLYFCQSSWEPSKNITFF